MRYFIQHPAGTGKLVLEALPSFVDHFELRYQDDSAMIFESTSPAIRIGSIPFVKNAFTVVTTIQRGVNIDRGVTQLSRSLATVKFSRHLARSSGFRIMFHIDGELASIDQGAKIKLERAIISQAGQRVESRGMCQEYWVVGRLDSKDLLLCARIPKEKRPPKARGAISYELASMLVSASCPGQRDIFLDPFAGSGSLVLARLDQPAREIWYCDRNLRHLKDDFPSELTSDKRVRFIDDDALFLQSIRDETIDVIVTDPPWGEHEDVGMAYQDFARAMATSFERVLRRPDGRFVLLSSRRAAPVLRDELSAGILAIRACHEILVNGHPATVLVGGRLFERLPAHQPLGSQLRGMRAVGAN